MPMEEVYVANNSTVHIPRDVTGVERFVRNWKVVDEDSHTDLLGTAVVLGIVLVIVAVQMRKEILVGYSYFVISKIDNKKRESEMKAELLADEILSEAAEEVALLSTTSNSTIELLEDVASDVVSAASELLEPEEQPEPPLLTIKPLKPVKQENKNSKKAKKEKKEKKDKKKKQQKQQPSALTVGKKKLKKLRAIEMASLVLEKESLSCETSETVSDEIVNAGSEKVCCMSPVSPRLRELPNSAPVSPVASFLVADFPPVAQQPSVEPPAVQPEAHPHQFAYQTHDMCCQYPTDGAVHPVIEPQHQRGHYQHQHQHQHQHHHHQSQHQHSIPSQDAPCCIAYHSDPPVDSFNYYHQEQAQLHPIHQQVPQQGMSSSDYPQPMNGYDVKLILGQEPWEVEVNVLSTDLELSPSTASFLRCKGFITWCRDDIKNDCQWGNRCRYAHVTNPAVREELMAICPPIPSQMCQNDLQCPLLNDAAHQEQYRHTCRIAGCQYEFEAWHAIPFAHPTPTSWKRGQTRRTYDSLEDDMYCQPPAYERSNC
eukprot:TRINITY_DN9855_c0_g1_i4.p1 TRINITY_DN9855_c0_g1~~TRINITY_DN9855_c0_g1_i4.p1  ORF type:complete len:541 (+),score=133.21 TRINITY_DN9855_c0_g1_i4:44-1666(+)